MEVGDAFLEMVVAALVEVLGPFFAFVDDLVETVDVLVVVVNSFFAFVDVLVEVVDVLFEVEEGLN